MDGLHVDYVLMDADMPETPRICVCGDTEAEHAELQQGDGDTSCAYCECKAFKVDLEATRELQQMAELLNGLEVDPVIAAELQDEPEE